MEFASAGVEQSEQERGTIELSLVIPCLNEAASLPICIRKAQRSLEELGIDGEVVVADNGSTDGSREIARELGARLIDVEERGYGSALLGGIAAAEGELVMMGDADDSYDWSAIAPFVERLREGYDVVLGNRFAGGIEDRAMPLLHRRLGNPVLTRLARLFFETPCGDIYCGLRGFRKSAIDGLNMRSTGMEFALEMVIKATLSGLRVCEVPTTLSRDARGDGVPHLRTWRDGWRSLRFFLLYSPRWLFLYPGLLLMAISFAVTVALLPGTLVIGDVSFDAHTLLYASVGIVIGYQGVVFAAFARLFAVSEGLLPESALLTRAFRYVTLETGLVAGALLLLAGLVGSVLAVGIWESKSLGRLNYADTLRVVIPSCTLLMLGCQTVLASFFLSILGLKRR
jgi:glycosyltransferase involved in cell wall biosynthesis